MFEDDQKNQKFLVKKFSGLVAIIETKIARLAEEFWFLTIIFSIMLAFSNMQFLDTDTSALC